MLNPGLHERLIPEIPKTSEPTPELLCSTDCNHRDIVAKKLRPCNALMQRLATKPPVPSNAGLEWQARGLERKHSLIGDLSTQRACSKRPALLIPLSCSLARERFGS